MIKKLTRKLLQILSLLALVFLSVSLDAQPCFTCDQAPKGMIFCDDFESDAPLSDRYFESGGVFLEDGAGRSGSRGIRVHWKEGQVGAGGFKKSFGRTPDGYIGKHAVKPDTDFDEIYWRIDLRNQSGWQGGGADKLSRAMTLANSNWAQGMIAHVWSGGPDNEFLGIDPASGIDSEGNLVSTSYNDWQHLRWLGFKRSDFRLFGEENTGKWHCIEAHAKLNTPGKKDGVFELWIDDSLQAASYDLNWHGNWNNDPKHFMINAIFVENYWNKGSPVEQERYMDNFIISTRRIGCTCSSTTANKNLNSSKLVLAQPNPAEDKLQFVLSPNISSRFIKIYIYNNVGQLFWESSASPKPILSVSVQNWPSGIYYYDIINDQGKHHQGKVIINQ